jgi:hygromycin-B 7''-O-kinase
LDEIWPGLADKAQLELASGLGRLMASLHSSPTAGLEALRADWAGFLQSQKENFLSQQQAAGTPSYWLAESVAFLRDLPPLIEPGFQPVLLHADLNPEHIFCERGPGGWQITGVIDFGDAMLGHPFYEFVAPGFMLGFSVQLRRAMLLAYGIQPDELICELSRRLMAYTLLHRFANLPEMLGRFEKHPLPIGMDALQAAFWGFDE